MSTFTQRVNAIINGKIESGTFILYPELPTEAGTVVNPEIPYGWLTRYTNNTGDGTTNISTAFTNMLNCGIKRCFVPAPTTAWALSGQVTWVPGVIVDCGRGCLFLSTRASGQWTFLMQGMTYLDGGGFFGGMLHVQNDGANGIRLYQTRNFHMDDFSIRHIGTLGGIGLELNGGDDAAPTGGCHHNVMGDSMFIYKFATGLKMYSDNTTSGLSTANCNRNTIGRIHINACTTGLDVDRASTNAIHCSLQSNTTGANIGATGDKNLYDLISEGNTKPLIVNASNNNSLFAGNIVTGDFVNGAGAATPPPVTATVLSVYTFQPPRDITLPNGGGWRFTNPHDAGPMRLTAFQAGQSLRLGQRLAAGTVTDLVELSYDATAPFTTFLQPLKHGTSSGPQVSSGTGTPEGAVTAPKGSLFHRTDGGAGTCVYQKESGAGNTGWIALVGASHTHPESDITSLVSDLALKAPLASPTFTGTVNLPGTTIIAAGSASANSWPKMTAGTVLTTAEDGAIEVDADCFYLTTDAGNRGVVATRHLCRADATRTFTSNTNQQAIFTTPANGTLTLETGCYLFEGLIAMTSMSGTSGNGKFSLIGAGSATLGSILWQADGYDAAAEAAAGATGGGWHVIATQTAVDIVTAAVATALCFSVKGTFEVTGAGTIIPSFAQTTAAGAIVSVGSYFSCSRIGSTSLTSVGQWT